MIKQIARFLLWIRGWKVDRSIPKESQRCVMVAAPHTSNWDFYYVRLAFWVLGIPMKVAIKDDWTKGIVGLVIKPLGGLGIDRGPKGAKKRKSQADAMSELFEGRERIALVIAPEGTRKAVTNWKNGYYWVAKMAGVPITLGYLDYNSKIAGVSNVVIHPTGDPSIDLPSVMDFYRNKTGRNPDNFILDQRYDRLYSDEE